MRDTIARLTNADEALLAHTTRRCDGFACEYDTIDESGQIAMGWGNGAGGLDGWADGLETIFSLVVGAAAGIATIREGRSIWLAIGVGITGLLIGVGYLFVGHLVDPCDRGWWDSSTRFGDTAACAGRGDIAEQYHLLLHAILGVISAGVAALVYRHWRLFGWWRPEEI